MLNSVLPLIDERAEYDRLNTIAFSDLMKACRQYLDIKVLHSVENCLLTVHFTAHMMSYRGDTTYSFPAHCSLWVMLSCGCLCLLSATQPRLQVAFQVPRENCR